MIKSFTTRVLHPFLLITFFVLYCWVQTSYFFDIPKGIIAWLGGLAVAGIGYATYRLFIKHPARAGVAWTLSMLLLLFYSPVYNVIQSTFRHRHLMPVFIVLIVTIFIFFLKSKKHFATLNTYLNTLFFILIIFEIFNLSQRYRQDKNWYQSIDNQYNSSPVSHLNLIKKPLPDVYYILMDGYTSPKSLKKYWDYDSAKLLNYLNEKNFYVAGDAHSNYDFTPQCMLSTFDMNYIPNYTKTTKQKLMTMAVYRKGIEHSKTVKSFTQAGYEWHNLSPFDMAEQKRSYHVFRIPDAAETWRYMAEMTLPGRVALDMTEPKSYEFNEQVINELENIIASPSEARPRFVYSHIFLPHGPYYYNEKCELNPNGNQDKPDMELYIEQLQCTESILINIIDNILINTAKPPIIIIQGDHGSRIGSLDSEEHFSILYAVYLPDEDYSNFYSDISPVNTFRILSNHYLNTQLELLEDKKNHFIKF